MSARRTRVLTVAGPAAAAVLGGVATDPDSAWFRRLEKPSWYPPPQAFGIVWTAYLLKSVRVANTYRGGEEQAEVFE